jgi:hypothetical protein
MIYTAARYSQSTACPSNNPSRQLRVNQGIRLLVDQGESTASQSMQMQNCWLRVIKLPKATVVAVGTSALEVGQLCEIITG